MSQFDVLYKIEVAYDSWLVAKPSDTYGMLSATTFATVAGEPFQLARIALEQIASLYVG
jgi:hypothetical protein